MVPVIAEALAGTRIAITGSTGFVGTALVERLLRSRAGLPARAARPRRQALAGRCGASSARSCATTPSTVSAVSSASTEFDADGGPAHHDHRRRRRNGRARPVGRPTGTCSPAATSSCTRRPRSPSTRHSTAPSRSTSSARHGSPSVLQDLDVRPHLVSVSTCYVAGNRRGTAPEELVSAGPFDLGLDWRNEVDAARRLRSDAEAASRHPERLAELRKAARLELGAAGAPALAAKTEQLRERWVRDQLIAAGRARAASVGWPDAYAFTKALGEQALTDVKGDVPVSIVRPSIIESALAEPRPGWIRGFRMAEPVLISYARGLLREFPGVPEGTIDVIPVDLVVAAIITVAALGPERGARHLPGRIRWHQPAEVPRARGQRQRAGSRSTRSTTPRASRSSCRSSGSRHVAASRPSSTGRSRSSRAASRCSRRCRCAASRPSSSARLESKRIEVERALEYVELYGLYSECEAIYQVDHLMEMWEHLTPERPGRVRLRPAGRRLADVHPHDPPALDRPARPRRRRRRRRRPRTARTGCVARSCRRIARSPPSTSRTR